MSGSGAEIGRYVITAVAAPSSRDAGKRFWLYWTTEGGGWWQWGPEAWAERFPDKKCHRYKDARASAATVGPFWAWPDKKTIEVRLVPLRLDLPDERIADLERKLKVAGEALSAVADMKGWHERPPISATGIQVMNTLKEIRS